MADEADVANDFIDSEVSRALVKIRQSQKKIGRPQSKVCIECGERIPELRLKLGFALCIECAAETERRQSLFADH